MSAIRTAQNRLIYSLLKPAVAMAASFHVPMRTLAELLRLSYFEVLRREGLSQAAVGERLGQTARHMRTLARKLKGDFFEAESEVGLVREVESEIARSRPTQRKLERDGNRRGRLSHLVGSLRRLRPRPRRIDETRRRDRCPWCLAGP